jgi:hypothetical protein
MPHEKEHKIRVEDIFRQSPIPRPPPTITDEEFNKIFNERSRKFQEEKQGLRDRWQEHLDTTGILDKEEEKKEEGGLLSQRRQWVFPPRANAKRGRFLYGYPVRGWGIRMAE